MLESLECPKSYKLSLHITISTGAMGVIDAVMGSDDLHRSAIDKTWREGHDYFRVEPQLVCHDGESIQVGMAARG